MSRRDEDDADHGARPPAPDDPVVPIEGAVVASPAPEEMPLRDDGVEATGGVRGAHSHAAGASQDIRGLDRGVDPGHLHSPSQGVRPEDETDATDPTLGPDERPGR